MSDVTAQFRPGTLVRASGDTTGATDRAALSAVVSVGGTAVLESAKTYYDDGTTITWESGARVVTTDERPAFWNKGSSATTDMSALPGCLNLSAATIDFNLPAAAYWAEQSLSCEITTATSATVDPSGAELIGTSSTHIISGSGDRLTVASRGVSPLIPVESGSSETRGFYGETVRGISDSLFFEPGSLTGGLSNERGNFEFQFGQLRSGGSFANASAIVGKDIAGTVWFDWQMFGSTSATGYLYWREAFPYGYRIQMTGSSAYVCTALGASSAIIMELNAASNIFYVQAAASGTNCIVVNGSGNVEIRGQAAQAVSILNGSTKRVEANATGLGFFAATPAAKPTVTGSRGSNAALASLLTALATLGLITDSSS